MKPRKKLASEREGEFRADLAAGFARIALSRKYGVHIATIDRWITDRGLPLPRQKGRGIPKPQHLRPKKKLKPNEWPGRSAEEIKLFREMWTANKSRQEMSAHFGITAGHIQRVRAHLKLPNRAIDYDIIAPWTKAEDRTLMPWVKRHARSADVCAANILPRRTAQAIEVRMRALYKRTSPKPRKTRALSVLLRPKIVECLVKHGAQPFWRITDYVGERPNLVKQALYGMHRDDEIVHVLGARRRDGMWRLPG